MLTEESNSVDYDDGDAGIDNEIIPETDIKDEQARLVQNTTKKRKQENLQWQENFSNIPDEDIIFRGSKSLPADISEMDRPYQIPRGQPGHNRLFKIRPFPRRMRNRLLLVSKEENKAVDEQIMPTKARSNLKQYNPKKLHKSGYKVLVLSYEFDIFAGLQASSTSTRFWSKQKRGS
ncbi:hypothetical protein ILUMI_21810 [Ignelater luminosus]|uniref:Uncharacterized protein n=1 Tax=Ignelater luminosus TaxID=2038154 RepID=A0A8K0CEZ8_IGNLU|nr:hypothetical protein ILUMI_21810 [Ignelater luminosus]